MRLSDHLKPLAAVALVAVTVTACEQATTSPETDLAPSFARAQADATPSQFAGLAAFVDDVNAKLAASGQTIRLDYPWLYRVGLGTDPFQTLRIGARWTTYEPEYVLDESDLAVGSLSAAEVEAALVSAYETWNAVPNSGLSAVRGADPGGNYDVLDGIVFDADGNCYPFDLSSPNLLGFSPQGFPLVDPVTDIVVGGFVAPEYFECLGSEDIIGVTWTFFNVDTNGDQYWDIFYVEQFYNPRFNWVTQGSQYLQPATGVDLETIALHENGHAHGLGHFGGPVVMDAQFWLKPTGRVFNPEAVMNPFYLYGEDRFLYPTDEAGYLTMYARP